jgi:putative serine protease PepD
MRTQWLAGGLLALGLVACTSGPDSLDAPTPTTGPTAPAVAEPSPSPSPEDQLAMARRSVVAIEGAQAQASGVVVDTDGHILTHAAVAGESSRDSVMVTFSDGSMSEATTVGADPLTSLAVVKVDALPDRAVATFADSDAIAVDDDVLVLSRGSGDATRSGMVLATNRRLTTTAGATSAVETDATGGPDSAGQPLVNPAGEILGIVVATTRGENASSAAVPSNIASRVADQLIADGRVVHPFLGTAVEDAPGNGTLVQQVADGSPAEQAGLQPGDVITRLGDRPVESLGDLLYEVQSRSPGDELRVISTRDGAEHDATVTLGEAPAE